MAVDLLAIALDAMAGYGLVAVFLLLLIDGMGLPAIPAEVILIIAVAEFARDLGGLLLIVGLAVVASMLGAVTIYAVGRFATRRRGPDQRRRTVLGVTPRRQEKMERTFSRPLGRSSVLFLRLFPLTRVLVSLPAGMGRMRFWPFLWLSTLGTAIFFAAFMWLAYEYRDPESRIGAAASSMEATYVNPAFQLAEANAILVVAALVVVGLLLSVRASRRIARDPDETAGSLVGSVATAVLFWGGLALLVGLWMDPSVVFQTMERGGVSPVAVSVGLPYDPLATLAGAAIGAMLLALGIYRLRGRARHKGRAKGAQRQAHEDAATRTAREEAEWSQAVAVWDRAADEGDGPGTDRRGRDEPSGARRGNPPAGPHRAERSDRS